MKSRYIQYYVEGEDEEKLIKVLKSDLMVIRPGKVQKLNVVQQRIPPARLRTLNRGTMVVLIFDTDTGKRDILDDNLKALRQCSAVSEIVLIPQVPDLETELVRCCKIKSAAELVNCHTTRDFKRDFIKISNLKAKLLEHGFDIKRLWSKDPDTPYEDIINGAEQIKIYK